MKRLDHAKRRLDACLGPRRRGLALAMFKDVAGSLVDSRAFAQVAVVTADPDIRLHAGSLGAKVIQEQRAGMNEAVRDGVQAIRAMGASNVAVIPADVPLITPEEVRCVVSTLQGGRTGMDECRVGIQPSRNRDGTNFLSIAGTVRFPFTYGPGSFARHVQAASRAGCSVIQLDSFAFALDIDTEDDLLALIATLRQEPARRRCETWNFLSQEGYAAATSETLCVMNE